MRLRIALVLCAALALSVGAATAAAGDGHGNSDAAKACQKDGWQKLWRQDASSFTNTGDCVSYAAQGGKLYSTRADLSLEVKTTSLVHAVQIDLALHNDGPDTATGVSLQINIRCAGVKVPTGSAVPTRAGPTEGLSPGETVSFTVQIDTVIGSCDGYAQVTASDAADPDSTPNNYANGFDGPAVEDDEVVFHVSPKPTCSTALSFAPRTGGGRGLLRHPSVDAAC